MDDEPDEREIAPTVDAAVRNRAQAPSGLVRRFYDPNGPLFAESNSLDLSPPNSDPKGDELRELVTALRKILGIADLSGIVGGRVGGLRKTRAAQLLNALCRDLELLAAGGKSPALQPRSPTSARQTRSLHPIIKLMKDESAVAADILICCGVPHEQAWEAVAEILKRGGYDKWGGGTIKRHHLRLKRAGELSARSPLFAMATVVAQADEQAMQAWTPILPPGPWDRSGVIRGIEMRLSHFATRAKDILRATDEMRTPKV